MFSRVRGLLKRATSGSNYPYVTARVRALKTYLLPESAFPKLIARDVHEIARSLEEGRYKQEIDELASEFSGARLVERATRLNMGREFRQILSWCKGEPEALLQLYFQRYEVHNVKTVLRGAQTGAPKSERRLSLIPVGTVPEERFHAALDAETIQEALQIMQQAGVEYARVLQGLEDEPLPVLENELDKHYYSTLVDSVPEHDRPTRAFRDFLKREVDVVNLKLILRAKHADVRDYELVPGGSISQDLARRVQGAEWSEVGSLLEETPYGSVLKGPLATYMEDRDLNHIAGALDHYHLEQAGDFGHRYPLSILPIVDYVLSKRHEVDRIRIIAHSKQSGLSREDIEELVSV